MERMVAKRSKILAGYRSEN